jgi:uncharacterized damage-inducible protein DinB
MGVGLVRQSLLTISDFARQAAQAYAVNDRMNQLILEHLDSRAWQAKLPGHPGRTIAAIFTHIHNMRRKWLRLSAPHIKLPAQLDRTTCTQKQAASALAESAARCGEMLEEALSAPEGQSFLRDGWARPWRPSAAMLAYMISHDAHHRGQVCMLAHQLGFQLPVQAAAGIWGWEKLSKECGFELTRPQKTKRPARSRAPNVLG